MKKNRKTNENVWKKSNDSNQTSSELGKNLNKIFNSKPPLPSSILGPTEYGLGYMQGRGAA